MMTRLCFSSLRAAVSLRRAAAFLTVALLLTPLHAQTWTPDSLAGYERHTVVQPDDYSGPVRATVVRRAADATPPRGVAVVYVHGFNDYFFQRELGDSVAAHGYRFYAVDLRKYGRSLLPGQRPFEVRRLDEYFADIDSTLALVRADGCDSVVLMGHSTGGLTTAYYMARRGADRPQVKGLILNSPFLDMNLPKFQERVLVPVVSALRGLNLTIPQSGSNAYAQSLLRRYHGEWDYDTRLKMERSPAVTSRWLSAIHRAQRYVQRRADIGVPILLLRSSRSVEGDAWTPEFNRGDAVLDVADMAKYGPRLGPDVTEVVISDGLHDLILSAPAARASTYRAIFAWLGK